MPTALELVLPLRPGLVPVPAIQPGVCRTCHAACNPDYAQCFPCHEADLAFGDLPEILPISMSIDCDLLHLHLRGYKDDRIQAVRDRMSLRLAALLALFLHHHAECIGGFDVVVAVPSLRRTALDSVLQRLPNVAPLVASLLRATGTGEKSELRADRFQVTRSLQGDRVLVLDDTFTRGPTLFSAVAALRDAGATVLGPIVLGRHVRPSWEPSQELLSWLRGRNWNETRCCRCAGERQEPSQISLF